MLDQQADIENLEQAILSSVAVQLSSFKEKRLTRLKEQVGILQGDLASKDRVSKELASCGITAVQVNAERVTQLTMALSKSNEMVRGTIRSQTEVCFSPRLARDLLITIRQDLRGAGFLLEIGLIPYGQGRSLTES